MPCQVKRYKNVLIDRIHNIRFEIYSNKKLNKSEMLLQVRFYYVKKDYQYPLAGEKVNIIMED